MGTVGKVEPKATDSGAGPSTTLVSRAAEQVTAQDFERKT